jgi:hypothetical protein
MFRDMEKSATGEIVFFQDRKWFGDRRLAAFFLTIDGRRIGKVPYRSQLAVSVAPGEHLVRVRQWWYRSPRTCVEVPPGATITLQADISRAPMRRRFLTFLFRPSSALKIEPV